MMKTLKLGRLSLVVASALGLATVAQAQLVINDTLTGASSSYNWQALNGACLTAGDGRASTIPACVANGSNLPYYSGKTLVGGATGKLPDAIGSGALRLTNGDTGTGSNGNNQTGAVVSNFTFPTDQGVQVTWTSVTYGGNAYQNNAGSNNKSGADGISFFLSDGAQPPTVGALGGSLGYSCSNGNGTYDGVVGGYIGIGMDEFGNFSNAGDNTSSGASTGQTPGAIVIRGAGHTAWAWLTSTYPQYYSSTYGDPATAVHTTCKTGKLYNYTGGIIKVPVTANTYTADYSYTKSGNTNTGSITSSSSIPSSSKCDNSGNPSSSGSNNCAYTNRAANSQTVANGSAIPSNVVGGVYQLDYNYPYLTGSNFPSGTTIFNQEAAGTTTTGGVTYSKAVRGPAATASGAAATPVTYSLTITHAGLLTFSYSINGGAAIPVIPSAAIPSLNITANNGPLPSSFRFGFSAGTGGGSNVHEITCFKAGPANTSGSSAGSNVLASQVQTSSQIYLAYFHPTNSWGSLTAQNLLFTAASGSSAATLVVVPTVIWDAGCVLTGGPCASQSTTTGTVTTVPTITAPLTYATRTILGWNGTTGIPFRYGNLPSAQSGALTAGDTTASSNRTDYLRGNQAMEASQTGGIYRTRNSLLGDIVDSSPVWVGPPNLPYSVAWSDLLYPTAVAPEGNTYGAYVSAQATRGNVVYAGSNDGMLHGFRAGSYSAAGVFNTANNDGREVLSYVPAQVATTIHSATNTALDFSSPSYSHNFFVDASPASGDLYYGNPGAWHTWVVGGLGPGGQANGPVADTTTVETGTVFALDVTDPTTFAESAASSLVKGEWSSASLNSVACTGSPTSCGDHLGATYGTPTIRRLHDGGWALIFGNGLNSKLGTAGLFIVHINPADGTTKSVQYIDTGVGSTTNLNGIVQATPVDLDGDHITDYVYAGDVQGNVWRFDLTSATASAWSVGPKLFTTQSGQPITSGIAVASVAPEALEAAATSNRVILAFGTGQKLPKTLTGDTSYPTTMQSIYGIWDANMAAWNGLTGQTTKYASLTTTLPATNPTITAGAGGNLRQSALNAAANTTDASTSSAAIVCWQGSTACSSNDNKMGWEMDLTVPSTGVAEQVLFNPLIVSNVFNTNTFIPVVGQALTCDTSSPNAYSYALDMGTGGAAVNSSTSGTTTTTSSYFSGYAAGTVRVATQATGTSSYVTTNDGGQWLVFQKSDTTGGTLQINPQGNGPGTGVGSRLTWTKMR